MRNAEISSFFHIFHIKNEAEDQEQDKTHIQQGKTFATNLQLIVS